MKHIVFFSGGIGSYECAKRVISQYGKEDVVLLFTDTKTEDEDLYRFLDDAVNLLDCEIVKIADGRDIWEVAKDVKYLPNSRIAQCSHILKQKVAREWIKQNYKPDECILYLGIDWTESHRKKAPIKHWSPYIVKFPMCDKPYLSKNELLESLYKDNIEIPRLYKLGFSHNNCGGFCFRAGIGHFKRLLDKMPERYKYHEDKEQELLKYLGRNDISILRRIRNGEKKNITLKELREESEFTQLELFDIGGCGCFSDNNE